MWKNKIYLKRLENTRGELCGNIGFFRIASGVSTYVGYIYADNFQYNQPAKVIPFNKDTFHNDVYEILLSLSLGNGDEIRHLIKEYFKIIMEIYEMGTVYDDEAYMMNMLELDAPDAIIKGVLQGMGIKSIERSPEDSNIFIIEAEPGGDAEKYIASWHIRTQSIDFLTRGIRKICDNSPIADMEPNSRINTIVHCIINMRNTIIQDIITEGATVEELTEIERGVFDKYLENYSNVMDVMYPIEDSEENKAILRDLGYRDKTIYVTDLVDSHIRFTYVEYTLKDEKYIPTLKITNTFSVDNTNDLKNGLEVFLDEVNERLKITEETITIQELDRLVKVIRRKYFI